LTAISVDAPADAPAVEAPKADAPAADAPAAEEAPKS
ncbi:MAG: preprotein translocase subunit SecG, partial [Anaerolineae bacterium]|nr:preprotein translocase subunit SecG [Anaerolineae bacterium]